MRHETTSKVHAVAARRYDDVAVIIPCLDEAPSIAGVIDGFKAHLPGAEIHVCDNGSSDGTAEVARRAGATVSVERNRGKGQALRRLLRDTEADVYIMVDGDLTYDISTAPDLVRKLCAEGLDLIVGARRTQDGAAYRRGHRFGNRLLTQTVASIFRCDVTDMLSGYRVMSRRFAKTFPISARGFEVETEMTIHAFQVDAAYAEVPVTYYARGEGTESKLNTWRDGFWILRTICDLVILERPVAVFGCLGAVLITWSVLWFLPVLGAFYETGEVQRFPTLVACATMGLTGLISIFSGVILAGISRTRRELRRLAFLQYPRPPRRDDDRTAT